VTGKRLFIVPNLLTHSKVKVDTSEKRVYDIVLTQSFRHIDSITISLPGNYAVESFPRDVALDNAYGKYAIHFKIQDNVLTSIRLFEQNAARFPAADYKNFASFMNEIYKADRSRFVFVKKEN
jgi:hypothetical protein